MTQCSRTPTSLLVPEPLPVRVPVTLADAPSVGEEEPEALKVGVSLGVPVPEADTLLVPVPEADTLLVPVAVPVVVAVSDPLGLCGRASRSALTCSAFGDVNSSDVRLCILPSRGPAALNCPRHSTVASNSQQRGMRWHWCSQTRCWSVCQCSTAGTPAAEDGPGEERSHANIRRMQR